ncbi:TonB dependent receptor [Dysgonomonas sp. BGC7]|uniref:TonB dependent receptor n=1 Tax=Dysgonomonas sp. BGC7 TaxID=1658008 RepID=UPI0006805F80|nr:TonB dependent receptor [Dysgonomonas sp. BGC7]MBD8387763.1 outer membrane beta-barrel protein [Dysgonomonas sp. BGC7]
MKKIIFVVFVLLLSYFNVAAQNITGRIVDTRNSPIEFATIVLQTKDSLFINTIYSDSLGYFSFNEDLKDFRLLAQHLMYNTFICEFSSSDVGKIQLNEKENLLSEIVINGERPVVKVINGKMTYDMPQLLKNKMAGNAYEAILELPGVSEQSDVIKLAGSNGVAIIINGKPSTMTGDQLTTLLKNMPKERIQSAEVMYSAPPQYHVHGAAINLVLSNNLSETPQLQGQVNTEYSQYHYADYKGGITLMYSTPKTSTDFMYQFGYLNHRSGLDLDSHHTINNILYNIEQSNRGYNKSQGHNIRLGNDLYLGEGNKLSLVYTGQIKAGGRIVETSKGSFSNSQNKKTMDSPVQMHNISLSYSSNFGLNTGVDYTFYKNHSTQNYNEFQTGREDAFIAQSKQNINKLSLYADQSHSLGQDWTLDYGTKFSYASDKSSQIYSSLKDKDLSTSNTDSNLDEYTYELYAGFSKEFSDKLSLKSHLTGEYYKHKGKDYWSAYPELELTYTIDPGNIIQYSISSDKDYPNYWEMVNSISHLSGYTEIHGNPDLKPYRSYETQLSYILKSKYIFTLYGSLQDDYFAQLPYQSSERLAIIYKTTNFDYSRQVGINTVIPFRISSILDSRLNLTGFYEKVKSNNFHDLSFSNDIVSFSATLNNTFNISSKPNIKAELSGAYMPKYIQGPATLSKMYKIDTGVKWTSNNNKAEVRFKVNDILNSWNPKNVKTQFDNQNLNMQMKSDNRYVSLSLTYKFGGFKENKRKEVDTSRFGTK